MSATLAQMRARALYFADFSAAPDQDQLDADLNWGIQEAMRLYALADPDRYLSIQTVTLAGGTEAYALASDFHKAHKVFYLPDATHRYPVDQFNLETHAGIQTAPLSAGTAHLWYLPVATVVTASVPSAQLPVNGELYAELWAALQLRVKQEDDLAPLQQQLAFVESKIATEGERDKTGAIQDVYRWRTYRPIDSYNDRIIVYRIMGGNVRFLELSR